MKQPKRANRRRPESPAATPPGVKIGQLPTGVRGLDEILGGGIPELSFNIIAGTPGCGKTTLAHQIVFANATQKRPALYFTLVGEPAAKMLRYQQQFSFFDGSKLGKAIRFINLSDIVMQKDLDAVFDEVVKQVTTLNPRIVVVDSFRSVARRKLEPNDETTLQSFIQRLAQFLTGWQATTFLVGEYSQDDLRDNPVFTVADGLFWLSQLVERNSVVRKLQVFKLRGQGSVPGLHTFHIREAGLQTFPRTLRRSDKPARASRRRLSTGIPELDRMMGGGLPAGDSLLVAGPSGTGKSALATQFIAAGLRRGEPAVVVLFEERPRGYIDRADSFGLKLTAEQKRGLLELVYLRPLDLSVDQITQEILDAVERVGAQRLVIDSLVGFEMALSPGFRGDFRESLYRMIVALTGAGVTILTTVEVEDTFTALTLSHYTVSFLTDDLIRLRYVEIDGQLRKVLAVIKMRGGQHSKDIREYVISDTGVVVIHPRSTDYEGLMTGMPRRSGPRPAQADEAPPEPKARK